MSGSGTGEGEVPQLQIWDDESREADLGTLEDGGEPWQVRVVLERVGPDLVRGRLSFRRGEARHDTAPVLVEETAEEVVRRAADLPSSMLHQLLLSARD